MQNYGIALILFSLVIKVILLPLNMKSKRSMMKTSRLTPRLKALEQKYGDDKLKYQQEVSKLYKEEKISPMGGCLWSLIPLIIMIGLYYVVRQPMTYLMNLSSDEINSIIATAAGWKKFPRSPKRFGASGREKGVRLGGSHREGLRGVRQFAETQNNRVPKRKTTREKGHTSCAKIPLTGGATHGILSKV